MGKVGKTCVFHAKRESLNWKSLMLGYSIFNIVLALLVLYFTDYIVETIYSYIKPLTLEDLRATFVLIVKVYLAFGLLVFLLPTFVIATNSFTSRSHND